MYLYIIFIFLILFAVFHKKSRLGMIKRNTQTWILDISNLFIQGTLIPYLQPLLFFTLFLEFFPQYSGIIKISPLFSFLLNFVVVDYLYYWNHRILHKNSFWPVHYVHHTSNNFDVFVTSRNTLWSSFTLVYFWINGAMLFLLANPEYYLLGLSFTVALDMWRHTQFFHPKLQKLFSKYLCLTTPIDHAWHHTNRVNFNYGANLNIFDKIHGTHLYKESFPEKLGIEPKMSFLKQLFFPFGGNL